MRLLFLLSSPPRSDAREGMMKLCAQLILRLAARHDVGLLYLRTRQERPIDNELLERCAFATEVPLTGDHLFRRARETLLLISGTPTWVSRLKELRFANTLRVLVDSWRPDIVQAEHYPMAQYLPKVGCPSVIDVHEPALRAAQSRASILNGLRRAPAELNVRAWRRYEPAAIKAAQAAVVFTHEDRSAILRTVPGALIEVIRPGVEAADLPGTLEDPKRLLFFGNFAHPPNIDAARLLINEIYPGVRSVIPDVTLEIVGAGLPRQLAQQATGGIRICGGVDDLQQHLAEAAIVVTPLRFGGGIRLKVLETLAAGRALVVTSHALAGLAVRDGIEVAIANSSMDFRDAIVRLLRDCERRRAMAEQAKKWSEENLSWEVAVSRYEVLYARLLKFRDSRSESDE
jgi:glycosyltransferase involved in cell wall biosynthesis